MRTVILANGEPPTAAELSRWLRPGDRLICADGGGRAALAAGLKPDVVVGDFDSLSEAELGALASGGAALERHRRDKDETDLELALERAAREGARDIVVLGALGGRFDHALANALLLALPALRGRRARLAAGNEEIALIRGGETAELTGAPGDLVSLIPLGDATGIVTEGLQYPLRGEALRAGPARGVSNTLTSARATVFVEAGLLLRIQIRSSPGPAEGPAQ